MNTTQAAAIHNVTTSTICRWCRNGKLAATKNERGHWVITTEDTTTATKKETVEEAEDTTIAPEYNTWEPRPRIGATYTAKKRHYISNGAEVVGLEIVRYKTGNIRWASLGDEGISNCEAKRVLALVEKAYVNDLGNVVLPEGREPREITRYELRKLLQQAVDQHPPAA